MHAFTPLECQSLLTQLLFIGILSCLELDRENFCVRVDQTELPKITRQEFSILELLLKHPKKVFSKEEIFEYAWEEAYMGETNPDKPNCLH